jgi:hypothetical protein
MFVPIFQDNQATPKLIKRELSIFILFLWRTDPPQLSPFSTSTMPTTYNPTAKENRASSISMISPSGNGRNSLNHYSSSLEIVSPPRSCLDYTKESKWRIASVNLASMWLATAITTSISLPSRCRN